MGVSSVGDAKSINSNALQLEATNKTEGMKDDFRKIVENYINDSSSKSDESEFVSQPLPGREGPTFEDLPGAGDRFMPGEDGELVPIENAYAKGVQEYANAKEIELNEDLDMNGEIGEAEYIREFSTSTDVDYELDPNAMYPAVAYLHEGRRIDQMMREDMALEETELNQDLDGNGEIGNVTNLDEAAKGYEVSTGQDIDGDGGVGTVGDGSQVAAYVVGENTKETTHFKLGEKETELNQDLDGNGEIGNVTETERGAEVYELSLGKDLDGNGTIGSVDDAGAIDLNNQQEDA